MTISFSCGLPAAQTGPGGDVAAGTALVSVSPPFPNAGAGEGGGVLRNYFPSHSRARGWRRFFKFRNGAVCKRSPSLVPQGFDDVCGDVVHLSKAFVLHAQQHGDRQCKKISTRTESCLSVHPGGAG